MERPLTEHIRADGQALTLREYEAVGGYQAARKALTGMTPQEQNGLNAPTMTAIRIARCERFENALLMLREMPVTSTATASGMVITK